MTEESRPDFVMVFLCGTAFSVAAHLLSGGVAELAMYFNMTGAWLAVSPNDPWVMMAFHAAPILVFVALATGGRVIDPASPWLPALLMGTVAGLVHATSGVMGWTLRYPDHALVDTVAFTIAGAGSVLVRAKKGLGGAAAGLVVGVLVGFVVTPVWASLFGSGPPHSILGGWTLVSFAGWRMLGWMLFGAAVGALFWSLVPYGERLADR